MAGLGALGLNQLLDVIRLLYKEVCPSSGWGAEWRQGGQLEFRLWNRSLTQGHLLTWGREEGFTKAHSCPHPYHPSPLENSPGLERLTPSQSDLPRPSLSRTSSWLCLDSGPWSPGHWPSLVLPSWSQRPCSHPSRAGALQPWPFWLRAL